MASVSSINASSVCLQLVARTSNEHYAYAMLSCPWTIQADNKGCHLSQLPEVNKPERQAHVNVHTYIRRYSRREVYLFGQVPFHSSHGYGQQLMQLRANYRISQRSPQRFSP